MALATPEDGQSRRAWRLKVGTSRRLRLAAGLTLLALAALVLAEGSMDMLTPQGDPDNYGGLKNVSGLVVVVVVGVPMLLAASAVLLGGTKGGVFGA